MNNTTRIEKDFYFQAGLKFNGRFYVNAYDINLSMLIETESMHEQNVAMDRISYFIKEIMQDCVMVDFSDTDSVSKYTDAGMRVCELPDEPWDQIVAMVLILKLNTILEGRLKITDMVFGSTMSEGVRYNIVYEVAENAFSGLHWWNKADTSIKCNTRDKTEKVIKLFNDCEWQELGLSWKEKLGNLS